MSVELENRLDVVSAGGMAQARESYWDMVRGVSIIAVVGIHALVGPAEMPVESGDYRLALILRQILDFAVPMFLALSGYMAGLRPTGPTVAYWRTRLGRLLPPYLFWTAVYVLLLKRDHLLSPTALAADVLLGAGIGIGYFVIVLAQMVVLTPLLDRIKALWPHALLILALTAFGLLWTYAFQVGMPSSRFARFPVSGVPLWVWYPFYHLGYLAARRGLRLPSMAWLAALWIALVVASYVEGAFWAGQGLKSFALAQTKATSMLASLAAFAVVVALYERADTKMNPALVWLGRNSYFVYLTHILTFAIITKLFGVAGIEIDPVPFAGVLVVGALAACSVGIAAALKLPAQARQLILGYK